MRIITLALLGLTLTLTSACNKAPTAEKVCEHLQEMAVGTPMEGDMDDCMTDAIPDIRESCGDKTDEAFTCLFEAESMRAANDCEEICSEE